MRLGPQASVVAVAALALACSNGSRDEQPSSRSTQALRAGFIAGKTEQAARGAPAIAVHPDGHVLVLDAVNRRIARVSGAELVKVADVPGDSDDLAIGPDGSMAVRRSVKPEILVLDPQGGHVGVVDTSALADVDGIALGRSRRVIVTTPFQETFSLGSPAMPQLPAAILASKVEGAATLASGAGVVAVRTDAGDVELRAGDARHTVGKADAGRIIGASGEVACARLEHVAAGPEGEVQTRREAACIHMASGRTVFRRALPPPGDYLPRRELDFRGSTLAFARSVDGRLDVTTWTVEGGAR